MQILVTGAAGFIGSQLSEKLLSKGTIVIGIDNLNNAYNPKYKKIRLDILKKNSNFIFHKIDLLQVNSLKEIFKTNNISTVYHLAARTGVRASIKLPALYQKTNVDATHHLYQLAHKYNVNRFIFASSSSVYGNNQVPFNETYNLPVPESPYADSKQKAEKLLFKLYKKYKIPVMIFRFFSVYGPFGRPDMAPFLFTEAIANNKPIHLYGDGTQARDYTYIDDVVSGLTASFDHLPDFEIINLGNDKPMTINTLIKSIEKILGKKALVLKMPTRQEEVKTTWADISKAKKLLCWEPNISFKTGIHRFVSWYTSRA